MNIKKSIQALQEMADNLKDLGKLASETKPQLDDDQFYGFLGDLDVLVSFDYSPPEEQTRTYPGCDASIDITGVNYNGVEILEGVEADTSHKRPKGERDKPSRIDDLIDQAWAKIDRLNSERDYEG